MFLDRIPVAVFDYSGAACVIVSLIFLVRKHPTYWHFSNLSLAPYFLLFIATQQYMLAGLQVSYLIFGLHGSFLWLLEHRRDGHAKPFNETFWYNLGWVLTLAIFAYTASLTEFRTPWDILQFVVTSLSLIANWATTRKWIWSWYVWIPVNLLQALLFQHLGLWIQVGLQVVLASMSVWGLVEWRRIRSSVTA
ncbi:nicotinamide mononucleotide transporter family protein [Lacibacterium aquatile]|uniref:Nicotinamide riboside transporter PnuC n=1 Tax=Lacibacterium aquatile TaxID=1168082 RepID=A0ABW5DTX9_9PROT